jgi:deoxyribonuclease (pyrimidine dimer)
VTRINLGVSVQDLCDQHLVAELKEIQRLPALARATKLTVFPTTPVLGTGHVTFFYPFGKTVADRAHALECECRARGFNAKSIEWMREEWPTKLFDTVPDYLIASFVPLIQARINERLSTMKRVPTWTKRTKPTWVTYGRRLTDSAPAIHH